ncbi:alpha/beta fold hydrolase [Noviherbaspirillum sp. ST9]|uniref:alpha/beta fold hydrolase n=1 Tax=Noviherbaspirillum sp. ST9 TaxID=3401606 RepID=UPI003B5887B6
MLENFKQQQLQVNGVTINFRHGGDGPPMLLLHGFPQTHVIWHKVADALARKYTLVMPDLRGYGDSSRPPGLPDHSNYSKRVMAQDMVELMRALGHATFYLCGHDRGARVSHRLALDHKPAVRKLMILDISPTRTMYEATDKTFATLYYHWFFMIQPAPVPETLIGNSAAFLLEASLANWGSNGVKFIDDETMAEYRRCFCRPDAIHAACEDYRAAASIDLEHDKDHETNRIACPVHVLWGEHGVVGRLFKPLEDWQVKCALPVTGKSVPGGHFIPEQVPDLLLEEMLSFFA